MIDRPFVPFPRAALDQTIPRRFEAMVARYPGRPAVVDTDRRVTYAELHAWTNGIAHQIRGYRKQGAAPVALLTEQGAVSTAATLGVLKAGDFYVPLDPSGPRALLCETMAESEATLLLASHRTVERAHELAGRGITVLDVEELDGRDLEDPALPSGPDDSAYIYFTSGSTGRPKGVFDTHRGVLHNILRYTNSLRIAADDRMSLLQGPSFSGAVSSLFAALLNGACSYPFDVGMEGVGAIAPWMAREALTVYHSVPALFRQVAVTSEPFPALRLIRLEGDRASARDIELFQGRFPEHCILVNGLGATECGLVCQFFVTPRTKVLGPGVPIGYPVEDMEVAIVDESSRELGPGEIGEIVVRSAFLARGYWRRPDLTAAKFHDIATGSKIRAYRTGDLGRRGADGCLEHLGRVDGAVRIRGQTVAIADVEAALVAHPGIQDAAVTVVEHPERGNRLTAHLVARPGVKPTVSELRRDLSARVPAPMIPSRFVFRSALPLNANLKVDRRALAASSGREAATPVAARNLLEIQLVQVWERVLGVASVGIRDDFFDLGGDSLSALGLLLDIEETMGKAVDPSTFLAEPTIEHLSSALRDGAAQHPIVALRSEGKKPPFIFLHGDYLSGGFFCVGLSRRLGPEQPFYALPPITLDRSTIPRTYQAMAEEHLAAIRTVLPHGPYRLGGLCNGGLVAFEIARLLEARGEPVDRLVLVAATAPRFELQWLDALIEATSRWTSRSPETALDRRVGARDIIQAFREHAWQELIAFLMARLAEQAFSRRRPAGAPQATDFLRRIYRRIDVQYEPRPYGGSLTLLWPREDPIPLATATRWWTAVTASVEAHHVPGTHITCLTRHLDESAAVISRCLDDVPGYGSAG